MPLLSKTKQTANIHSHCIQAHKHTQKDPRVSGHNTSYHPTLHTHTHTYTESEILGAEGEQYKIKAVKNDNF